ALALRGYHDAIPRKKAAHILERIESRQHNGITLRGLSQPAFATKSARSGQPPADTLDGLLRSPQFRAENFNPEITKYRMANGMLPSASGRQL
ncbi:MAG: hypothetical protein ACXWNV_19785, partial [Vulcanimicrobiaceae bacterium]